MKDWRYELDSKKTISNDVNEIKQNLDYLVDHIHILTDEVKKLKMSLVKEGAWTSKSKK